jgi:hypothetical protein
LGGLFSRPRLLRSIKAGAAEFSLVDLAAMLEPDGGMPGDRLEMRAGRSIAAVLALVADGHTLTRGAFRSHVARLVVFLNSLSVASDREKRLIQTAIEAASSGQVPAGKWLDLAREPGTRWKQIEAALK